MLNDLEGDKNNKPNNNKKPFDGTSHALNNPTPPAEKEEAQEITSKPTIPAKNNNEDGLKLPPKDNEKEASSISLDEANPLKEDTQNLGHALNSPEDGELMDNQESKNENSLQDNNKQAEVPASPLNALDNSDQKENEKTKTEKSEPKAEAKVTAKPAPNPWESADKPAQDDGLPSKVPAPKPVKKSGMPSNKRLTIWLVILIIVLVVAGGYYFWPSAEKVIGTATAPKPVATTPAPTTPTEQLDITKDTTTPAKPDAAAATSDEARDEPAEGDSKPNATHATDKADMSMKPSAEPEVDPFADAKDEYSRVMANLNTTSSLNVIKQLAIVLQKTPNYNPARATLAAMLIKYDQPVQALGVLKVGLMQDPANQQFAELTAHVLVQRKEIRQALAILKRAQPATTQSNPTYMAFMAALYLQQKDYQSAKTIYQSLVEYNSNKGDWWAGLGISLQKLSHAQDAYNAFNHAETLGGLSPTLEAYVNQALQGSI
jgi:tetratricopeptide (TPR) repeat protein